MILQAVTSSGTYTHADGEVELAVDRRTTYDDAERATGYIEHWLIRGEIQASGEAIITAALAQLATAYSSRISRITLYNGASATHHDLTSNGSLAGIRVLRLPSFPSGDQTEYVNRRRYEIELEAEYPTFSAPNLISFSEQVMIQGSGGPRLVVKETRNTEPQMQTVSQRTPVYIIQSGTAVGRFLRPQEPPPLLPQHQNHPDTVITPASGRLRGNLEEGKGIAWSYTFLLPKGVRVLPHGWPKR